MEIENPEKIIINGDLIDNYQLSKFPKSPHMKITTYEEVGLAKSFFEKLKVLCPKSKIIWIWGNHDIRVQKYIYAVADKLADFTCLDLEYLVGVSGVECVKLDKNNAQYTHNYIKEGDFYIGHFNRANKWAGSTPKNLIDTFGVSLIQSHTHKIGSSIRQFMDRTIRAYEIGCMCETSYIKNPDWATGWGIIEKSDGIESFYQIELSQGGFIYNGKIY